MENENLLGVRKYGFNTDKLSNDLKNRIQKLWEQEPNCLIRVSGTARPEFLNWISLNYPKARPIDDYFSIQAKEPKEE